MTAPELEALALEADIRIAVWNTCRERGMSQDAALSFIAHLFEQPLLARSPQP